MKHRDFDDAVVHALQVQVTERSEWLTTIPPDARIRVAAIVDAPTLYSLEHARHPAGAIRSSSDPSLSLHGPAAWLAVLSVTAFLTATIAGFLKESAAVFAWGASIAVALFITAVGIAWKQSGSWANLFGVGDPQHSEYRRNFSQAQMLIVVGSLLTAFFLLLGAVLAVRLILRRSELTILPQDDSVTSAMIRLGAVAGLLGATWLAWQWGKAPAVSALKWCRGALVWHFPPVLVSWLYQSKHSAPRSEVVRSRRWEDELLPGAPLLLATLLCLCVVCQVHRADLLMETASQFRSVRYLRAVGAVMQWTFRTPKAALTYSMVAGPLFLGWFGFRIAQSAGARRPGTVAVACAGLCFVVFLAAFVTASLL